MRASEIFDKESIDRVKTVCDLFNGIITSIIDYNDEIIYQNKRSITYWG